MKPIRLRAAIVEQAVLRDKVDIDEALKEYDKFLEKKLRQKIREKEAGRKQETWMRRQIELEVQAKQKLRQEAQERLHRLKAKNYLKPKHVMQSDSIQLQSDLSEEAESH